MVNTDGKKRCTDVGFLAEICNNYLPCPEVVGNMESCQVVIPLQSVHSGMFVDVKVTVDEGQDVEGERHRVAHHNPPRYVAPHSHPCLRVLHHGANDDTKIQN